MATNKSRQRKKGDSGLWQPGGKGERPTVEWAARGRVAYGFVTLLVGLPESGKSTFLSAVAAQVMGGPRLFDGDRRQPQGVMWISLEEDYERDIEPRVTAAGGDVSKLFHPHRDTFAARGKDLCFPDGERYVKEGIKINNIGLLVVESITDALCQGATLKSYEEMSAFMLSHVRIAREMGIAVVLSHHGKKGHRGPLMEFSLGSAAIPARARICLASFRDPKDKDRYYITTYKRGPAADASTLELRIEKPGGVPKVAWARECDLSEEDLRKAGDEPETKTQKEKGGEWLLAFLNDGPKWAKEVDKNGGESGHKMMTLYRACVDLGGRIITDRSCTPPKSMWHHPLCACDECKEERKQEQQASTKST